MCRRGMMLSLSVHGPQNRSLQLRQLWRGWLRPNLTLHELQIAPLLLMLTAFSAAGPGVSGIDQVMTRPRSSPTSRVRWSFVIVMQVIAAGWGLSWRLNAVCLVSSATHTSSVLHCPGSVPSSTSSSSVGRFSTALQIFATPSLCPVMIMFCFSHSQSSDIVQQRMFDARVPDKLWVAIGLPLSDQTRSTKSLHVMMSPDLSLIATVTIGLGWPRNERIYSSWFRSQMMHVVSREPDTMMLNGLEVARAVTGLVWPCIVLTNLCVSSPARSCPRPLLSPLRSRDHTHTIESLPPVTIVDSSQKVRQRIGPMCMFSIV
eukprot:comp24006_c1_seq1/m.42799 comp24006_c1_seq1/g.42799  ORF comp24006_c1_seq1/g.42799 comp24006_c1_seq1/m.42799 type:complete len:317 (+) comp24006_c1_seq1:676-1626(+)